MNAIQQETEKLRLRNEFLEKENRKLELLNELLTNHVNDMDVILKS